MAHAFVGWQVEMAPDGSLRRRVQHLCGTNRYDLIVGRYLWPLALAEAWKQAPVAVDLDNVGSKIASAGLRRGRLARAWHGRRARQLREAELRALDKCSLAWAAKQSDLPESGAVESRVLPNIAYRAAGSPLPDPDPINRRSTTTLIVASFSHVPNVRGVEEFLRYSWPQVLRSVPEASLRIVGSGISDHMKRRWQEVEGVSAVGFAENLDEEYRRAACTVVPLWEGGGTKIKVLESLLFGRPSVVSRHAWQGYEEVLHDRQSLWIADDSEDVARGCVELLRNYELRESMARAGREEVVHHYSFSRFRQAVRESVERAINSAPGRDSAS
jgi:glycosyltransferase involved in cell wall biosynthesis